MQAIKKLFKKLSGREKALPEEREAEGMNEEIIAEELTEAEDVEVEECASAEERAADTERAASAEAAAGNRKHLTSSVPRSAKAPLGVLTKREIGELREIFSGLTDTEIQRLYKRVTKKN